MTSTSERARVEGTPLVEGDGVTFVWIGDDPPQIVGDWNRWGLHNEPLEFVEESDATWTAHLSLAADAYLEYRFERDGTTIPDPLNRRRAKRGLGADNDSLLMPEGSETTLIRPPRSGRGSIERHEITGSYMVSGGRRTVWLYDPAADEPVPLMVVLDGQDYLRHGRLPAIVDNLIAAGRTEPIAMAMVRSSASSRHVEYAANDATLGFLLNHVIPLATTHLNLIDAGPRGWYAILGASMGGLMALYTGLRAPEVFGRVISQSGAFGTSILHHPLVVDELVDHLINPTVNVWMDCGRYEWLLEANREMYARLRDRGVSVEYREFSGGHNWTAWRNDIAGGLESIFGPAR